MERKKLRRYIKHKYGGLGEEELRNFANDVSERYPEGGASYGAVRKWLDGSREPRRSTRIKIRKMSQGYITLLDW